jgi:uncharacterized protein (TIGR00369 family)
MLPELQDLPPIESLKPVPPVDDSSDPWRREVVGEVLPQSVWDRYDGLEVLRRQVAGVLPRPPLSYFTGIRFKEVGLGTTTFVLPASRWLSSPTGLIEGGFIAMCADTALQSAIQTTAPAGCAVASMDLKVNFLRPAVPDGRELIGRGAVVHQGRALVIANAEVLNPDGKRVALATGSALLLPGRPASLDDPEP